MKVPFKYSIHNFGSRKLTTAITILGIALVVFVFSAVLMMAYGINKTLAVTGSDDNVVIVRKGSNGEISSIIDAETQNIVRALPHIAKTDDGRQVLTASPVVVINLKKPDGGMSNVMVRGVEQVIAQLHPELKITQGKMFNPSLRELIVGESISDKFADADIGNTIKIAGDLWKIVGKFSTDGGGFDSEIWGDSRQLLDAFSRGSTVSTMTLKLDDRENFNDFKAAFDADKRLKQFEPKIESSYFAEQSEFMASFIRILGIFVTVIFSIGATVGATITMYSAVANRTREIGTLRALGFSRRSILTVFLTESVIIALLGGVIGLFLSSFLQFFTISTLNFDSFAELAFSFALSPSIVISSLIFALVMGVLGGFLPAARAARLKITNALRTA
jgi:putative ABC transport system permease protein